MSNIVNLSTGPARRLFGLVACSIMMALTTPLSAQKAVPTAAELLDALKGKATRGVALGAVSAADQAKEGERVQLIQQLKSKALRGLSNGANASGEAAPAQGSVLSSAERTQLAEAVKGQPSINIEVTFAFNSAEISNEAIAPLTSLGKALQDGSMKDVLLAGHTDAKGNATYNQSLSQRRADAVRAYLIKNFSITEDKLVSVGYGRERLKDEKNPYADVNRRVQVVNMIPATTTAAQ